MARPPTANLEAYDTYLRAEREARTGRHEGLSEALALYEKAQKLDPTFAEAFAADARTSVYVWRMALMTLLRARLREGEPMKRQAGRWSSIQSLHPHMPFSA